MLVRLDVAYRGTNFAGFQVQRQGIRTVQGVLEEALASLTGQQLTVTGASRTDSGVHARQQVVSFENPSTIPAERFHLALNTRLPGDVRILASKAVPSSFHPQFSAVRKQYRYYLDVRAVQDPFWRPYAWHQSQSLNWRAMEVAASLIPGRRDFAAFCASGSSVKTTTRTVSQCQWQDTGSPHPVLVVEGDGFLYHMVRIIVGTLLEVGRGAQPPGWVSEVLASGDRNQAGPTAPAHGLFLERIDYAVEPGDG